MRVNFSTTYLSIVDFPSIDLPDFVVLTGENGAGKTHFLQALDGGRLRCDIAPSPNEDIKYFEWQSFVPQDTGGFNSENVRQERENLKQNFESILTRTSAFEHILSVARSNGVKGQYLTNPIRLIAMNDAELVEAIEPGLDVSNVRLALNEASKNADSTIIGNIDNENRRYLRSIAESRGKPIVALSAEDFSSYTLPNWGQANIFQQSFGRLFGTYRDERLRNDVVEVNYNKGRSTAKPLSDEEFISKYGPSPWEFVNTVLSDAGLDFYINNPDLTDFTQYTPQLYKKSSDTPISFGALSSGEKVLVSFAFCVYYASDRRQLSVYPKLILLDEVDAPLHPSMSKTVTDTITNTLIGKFGLKVILATHSPSTVAVSPEEAIYVMKKGISGLHKTSKPQALNLLTVGVPTIAISYDGRRQVFVESPADAETYGELYKLLKSKLNSERSLEFVATGTRSPSGEERNTGCDVVKRLVNELSKAGNISVFGLLDWDGRNDPADRVAVLAHRRRNGLENVIFDPLLIALLICRDCGSHKSAIGLDQEIRYHHLAIMQPDHLQPVIDRICHIVFESPAASVALAEYVGGLKLNVDTRWFLTDDHTLESSIQSKFPFIKSVTKNQAGKLMQHVIANILGDYPNLMPIEAMEVLQVLLAAEAHPISGQ